MTENWYYKLMGLEFGPVTRKVVAEMIQGNHLTRSDEVRRGDSGPWSLAGSFSELFEKQPESETELTMVADAAAGEPPAPVAPGPDNRWYCYVLEQQLGPLTLDDLCRMVSNGELAQSDYVKQGLHGRWTPAGRMPGLYFTRVALT